MTLGELILRLQEEDPEKIIVCGFDAPHSYRGYYDELAFEPCAPAKVGEMLAAAKSAVGATFEGWKGGEFTMHEYTDVWLAVMGSCGEQLGPRLLGYMLRDVAEAPEGAVSNTEGE